MNTTLRRRRKREVTTSRAPEPSATPAPLTAAGGAPGAEDGQSGLRSGVRLSDKYTATTGRVLISGIEALVRNTLDQRRLDRDRGLDTAVFVSGYEGSPLGGVDLEMTRNEVLLHEAGVVFSPGLNEELAATAVAGTQLLGEVPGRRHDGVTGFWYGKNPGLDRAADAIRHANYSGTAPLGGAVAWIGDDPLCKSSTLPSSCEPLAASLAVPLLAPSSVADILELGLHAVALSRFAGVWVGLKIVADIADGAATVDLGDAAGIIPLPDLTRDVHQSMLLGPQSLLAEEHLFGIRLPRATEYASQNGLNRIAWEPDRPRIAIMAAGLGYAAVLRALSELGLDERARQVLGLRLIKIAMPWPLDPATVRNLTQGLEEVVVIEDKTAFVEAQVKQALYRQPHEPLVVGKEDPRGRPLVPAHGAVSSEIVAGVLAARLGQALPEEARRRLEHNRRPERLTLVAAPVPGSTENPANDPAIPARTPYFCSGCPHNISTRATDDQLVGLGIGCHIMVAFDDNGRGRHLGMTQMGGEGAQWTGLAPFTDDPHFFQNIGDGTFFHSGSLAVRAAVAAGVDITYKLLYNGAVAMTGGQPPEGQLAVPSLVRWLALEGVKKVVVTTPRPADYRGVTLDAIAEVRHRDELPEIQAELGLIPGVTVLIHDDMCAAEERRLRKRGKLATPPTRVWINERVCEGCGDCGEKSTCLSVVPIDTEFGRKTAIHQGSCNQDFSCLRGDCPSFIEVVAAPQPTRQVTGEPPVQLPTPEPRVRADDFVARMPGIGGTGVVTTSRILQMAAHLSERYAAGVEQTGLAQKGGPVVSDVRISSRPIDGAVAAGARSADLLLGFDLLGAASPANLAVADRQRTVAVVNTAQVATAAMVKDTTVSFPPPAGTASRIERETRTGENAYLDAGWIAERLTEDHLATNMVLLGAAYQHGCLPVSAEAIEKAIALNGASVAANVAAFRWGRAAIVAPEVVHRALEPATPESPTSESAGEPLLGGLDLPDVLHPILAARVGDLIGYQNERYARTYLNDVLAVLGAELEKCPSAAFPVTTAYARNLYKLMAYKDEYEVARLHLSPVERAKLEFQFGPGARTRVMLHPPVLRSMGLTRKISFGRATGPAFRMLRAGRRLRGTWLDPFGRTAMRRTERQLVGEYRSLIDAALPHLSPATIGEVTAIAELPDGIRGYEGIKRANIERFRARRDELLDTLVNTDSVFRLSA